MFVSMCFGGEVGCSGGWRIVVVDVKLYSYIIFINFLGWEIQ